MIIWKVLFNQVIEFFGDDKITVGLFLVTDYLIRTFFFFDKQRNFIKNISASEHTGSIQKDAKTEKGKKDKRT
jgi:hypothetical protein